MRIGNNQSIWRIVSKLNILFYDRKLYRIHQQQLLASQTHMTNLTIHQFEYPINLCSCPFIRIISKKETYLQAFEEPSAKATNYFWVFLNRKTDVLFTNIKTFAKLNGLRKNIYGLGNERESRMLYIAWGFCHNTNSHIFSKLFLSSSNRYENLTFAFARGKNVNYKNQIQCGNITCFF